jgi:hypothetical protein
VITQDRIAAIAPDAQTIARAQTMAAPHKWRTAGQDEHALWGQCQGAELYDVVVDLADLGSRCTCPVRKTPCKHALALLMLSLAGMVMPGEPPAWAAEWMGGRARKTSSRGAAPDPEAQQKRIAEREVRIAAGLEELSRWLEDQARQGIAAAPGRSWAEWDQVAARLVDAQAPGLARRVRALYGAAASGEGWPDRVAEKLAIIALLVRAYRRQEELPEGLRADVRAQIGWTQREDDVLAAAGVSDVWQVLGVGVDEDERYRSQRTWLVGKESKRSAVILAFAAAQAPLDRSLVPGTAFEGELAFYPGAAPMRALMKARGEARPATGFPGRGVDAALGGYAEALARTPWLDSFPLALAGVVPLARKDGWWLRDARGDAVRLSGRFERVWEIAALAGGAPVGVFGEWDGETLWPLTVFAEEVEEL